MLFYVGKKPGGKKAQGKTMNFIVMNDLMASMMETVGGKRLLVYENIFWLDSASVSKQTWKSKFNCFYHWFSRFLSVIMDPGL